MKRLSTMPVAWVARNHRKRIALIITAVALCVVGVSILNVARVAQAAYKPYADQDEIDASAQVCVERMQEWGIMMGSTNNTFMPEGELTAEQIVLMTYRLARNDGSITESDDSFGAAWAWAETNNILIPSISTEDSKKVVTGLEVAQIIYNYYVAYDIDLPVISTRANKTLSGYEDNAAVTALYRAGIIDSEDFKGGDILSRQNAAKLLCAKTHQVQFNLGVAQEYMESSDIKKYATITIVEDGVQSGDFKSTTISEPEAPQAKGYTFLGWYLDGAHTQPVTWGHNIDFSTGNTEFFAKWSADVYNIDYVLNGGANAPANPSTYTIEDTPVTILDASRDGYDFIGWADGTGNVSKGVTIPKGEIGDKTLTAIWSDAIQYDIIYHLGGGDNHIDNPTFYTVESADIVLGDPTLDGYDFVHWTLSDSPATSPHIPLGSTGEREFTAVWSIKKYNVDFVVDDNIKKTEIVDHGADATAPAVVDTDSDKRTFLGWDIPYTNVTSHLTVTAVFGTDTDDDGKVDTEDDCHGFEECEVDDDDDGDGQLDVDEEPCGTGLDANVQCHTVIFVDGYTGNVITSEKVATGATAPAPVIPNHNGQTSLGWDRAFSNITSDLTVTAMYRAIPPTPVIDDIIPTTPVIRYTPDPSPVTSSGTDEKIVDDTEEDINGVQSTIVDKPTVKGDSTDNDGSWALLNLILTIITAVVGLVSIIGFFTKDEDEDRHGVLRTLALISGIGAVITFLLTENMSLPMGFVDSWTILMALIAVAGIVLAIFAVRDNDDEKDSKKETRRQTR